MYKLQKINGVNVLLFNKLFLWSTVILPWFTLFLMKKEEIRRYLPVGIFAALSSVLIVDMGLNAKFWVIKENIFPLINILPYHLGAVPVVTMWLFKFTYGKFLRYITVEAIYNLVFAFLMNPWLVSRGIIEINNSTGLSLFFITTIHGFSLYIYQIVQEGRPFRISNFSSQPATAKPFWITRKNK